MRVTELGTRTAPATIREFVSRMVLRNPSTPIAVERRRLPYWQEHGWTHHGNEYRGSYQTPYEAFQGWIEERRSGQIDFYLYKPSAQMQSHSHWACFQHRGNDWYLIHMARHPRDVSSGIMTIERLIKEAYEQ